jgi:ABC-2 type transport system ATP-binding protein
VEHSCERIIIINQGKLVAQDTVTNLTNRLRGSEQVALEIQSVNGNLNHAEVRQRLEQVAGVSRVVLKDTKDNSCAFEVESLQGRSIRAELARAVVGSGWDLNELRPVGFSLEDIFLQLTAAEKSEKSEKVEKPEKTEKAEANASR